MQTGCGSGPYVGWSNHQVWWQPVPGATGYEIYARLDGSGPADYNWYGTVVGAPPTINTANSVKAFVKVKACNLAGCSWLSAQTYVQFDTCPP